MTKSQLLEIANGLGIEGLSTNNLKADIISAILNVTEV